MNTTFNFNGDELEYFIHPHNRTAINERKVEVPIVMNYINKRKPKHILEVGNVLHHYYPELFIQYNVLTVDKYEIDNDNEYLINEDIYKFIYNAQKNTKYDLIVSISTLEHVGVDDYPKDKYKKLRVSKELISKMLTPTGLFVATMPLNSRQNINNQVEMNGFNFTNRYYMERYDVVNNLWKQSDWRNASVMPYRPSICASGIVIGIHDAVANIPNLD